MFGDKAGMAADEAQRAGAAALRNQAPPPAARRDSLFRAGRPEEARSQLQAAAQLSRDAREKAFPLARAAACA